MKTSIVTYKSLPKFLVRCKSTDKWQTVFYRYTLVRHCISPGCISVDFSKTEKEILYSDDPCLCGLLSADVHYINRFVSLSVEAIFCKYVDDYLPF